MSETKTIEVTVSRTIPATPDEVYDLWLDPTKPGGPWFGNERAIVDAKVDGLFYHAVLHQGRQWAHYGRFLRLERATRIEHTWMSEATRGFESIVAISLEAQAGETLFTLTHSGLPDDAMGRQHEDGWKFISGALADALAARKKA